MSKFPRTPAKPPAVTPNDPRYYDPRDLEAELLRTFQICHECRMCVGYCGSFPELFDRVDRDVDVERAQGSELINADDIVAISEACWQCKLCYIKCPYTKDDDARELLDFPRLMAREKANRVRRDGIAFVDRVLGEPQLIGQLVSGPLASLGNLINEKRLVRKLQEKVAGVSADFPLPPFASKPFPQWFHNHTPSDNAGDAGDVVLFATCYGNYYTPQAVQAAVLVLEHAGYRVHTVEETCCGMPNLDGGDVAGFVEKIRTNVAQLLGWVEQGLPVLVPSPTCGYTLKKEWAEYVQTPEVTKVAEATLDIMEFLERLRRKKELPPADQSMGKISYHVACHLRAQKVGFPAARVIGRTCPDTDVEMLQECSAVDGTWGLKAEHYETGRRYARKLVEGVQTQSADMVMTDCGMSALRIEKETGRRALHPVEVLAMAYGLIED